MKVNSVCAEIMIFVNYLVCKSFTEFLKTRTKHYWPLSIVEFKKCYLFEELLQYIVYLFIHHILKP